VGWKSRSPQHTLVWDRTSAAGVAGPELIQVVRESISVRPASPSDKGLRPITQPARQCSMPVARIQAPQQAQYHDDGASEENPDSATKGSKNSMWAASPVAPRRAV